MHNSNIMPRYQIDLFVRTLLNNISEEKGGKHTLVRAKERDNRAASSLRSYQFSSVRKRPTFHGGATCWLFFSVPYSSQWAVPARISSRLYRSRGQISHTKNNFELFACATMSGTRSPKLSALRLINEGVIKKLQFEIMMTPLDILPQNHRDKHILARAPKDYSLCTAAPFPEKKYFLRGGGGCTRAKRLECCFA